ncbi:glycosyltransferase [Cypionkella sp. TWP1-2-1b2]|uniref:glycosyltransferase n=1 Tax=Cypionkella sp. TWP1-2-1b2 TaxID=2804675 RepID=UPI003CF640FE
MLALYNGALHLRDQLDSFLAQSQPDWALSVGDDGSTDSGPQIVQYYAARAKAGQITVTAGPQRGGAANFLSLLSLVPADQSYTCFSDQDDVWLPHKLSRAILQIEAAATNGPICYFSRTLICREDLSNPRLSRPQSRLLGFRNALVQNVVAGNTIMVNAEALAVLQAAYADLNGAETVLLHDWWVYQILSGVGATFIADDMPSLLYRQHGGNQIGANDGLRAKIMRLGMMVRGTYAVWNQQNLAAIRPALHRFTQENRQVFHRFERARQAKRCWTRMSGLRASQVYRQGRLSHLALYCAALINRI